MKQTGVREQRFFPWAHESQGLELSILGGQLDAQRLEVVDPHSHILDLSAAWQRARLVLEIRAPQSLFEQVLPSHEHADPPVAVLVAWRCVRTYLRRRVARLDWAQGDAGRFELALELDRDELADRVEVDAFLLRSRAESQPTPGFAARVGARLVTARPWILQIDEPVRRSGNYLDIQYRSFARELAIAPHHRTALYRLELEREDPILYLNADHEQVRAVLDNKGTRGRRARTRELLFERIESGVWTQMLVHSSARLAQDGELAYPWEQAILDQWLPRLYPDLVDDAARREALARDHRRLPQLLVEIDAALQAHGELGSIATKLAAEL